jgi:molybdenum cofactor guanylyltransferase
MMYVVEPAPVVSVPGPDDLPPYDAVVLTGGRARRMDGTDKPAVEVAGRPLVLRVAAAVPDAARVVVVGPTYPGLRADVVTRERPAGSGPVAALAEGARNVRADQVVVLAADLPFLDAAAVRALRAAVRGHDLALLVDDTGRDQYLVAAWRTAALRDALAAAGPPEGASLRRLVAAVPAVVRHGVRVGAGDPPPWFDCDTEADVALARRIAGRRGG